MSGLTGESASRRIERRTAAEMAEPLPSLLFDAAIADIVDVCLSRQEHDWLLLVDHDSRPVRLVERAAILRGEPFEHRVTIVGPDTTDLASARQAMSRNPRERLHPLICCDGEGGCLGLVRVERLLEALVA